MATARINARVEIEAGKYFVVLDVPAGDAQGDVVLFRQDVTNSLTQAQKDRLAYIVDATA